MEILKACLSRCMYSVNTVKFCDSVFLVALDAFSMSCFPWISMKFSEIRIWEPT